jgi:hypothetical protein
MSRRKFTDGWEGLFEGSGEIPEDGVVLMLDLPQPSVPAKRRAKVRITESTKSYHKSFSSDLDSFLQEAFEDSFEAHFQQTAPPAQSGTAAKNRQRASRGGLDSLFKSTLDPEDVELDRPEPNTRRLVLFLDEEKISRLKLIAKTERKMLRSVVDEIVGEFIAMYEKSN